MVASFFLLPLLLLWCASLISCALVCWCCLGGNYSRTWCLFHASHAVIMNAVDAAAMRTTMPLIVLCTISFCCQLSTFGTNERKILNTAFCIQHYGRVQCNWCLLHRATSTICAHSAHKVHILLPAEQPTRIWFTHHGGRKCTTAQWCLRCDASTTNTLTKNKK